MSRFDSTRWGRILAWTGAALAWGSALTATGLEPLRAQGEAPPAAPTPVVVEQAQPASLPSQPAGGLIILRYRPTETPDAAIETVRVRRQVVPVPRSATPSPSAPAPRSRGS